MKKQLLYSILILITFQSKSSLAASFIWTGNNSSSWSVSGNWSGGGGGTPGPGDNITINSNAPNNLVLDQNQTVTNFTINGDTLDLGTYILTTTGVTYFNGGLVNNGNLSISGSLCHFGTGSIIDARIQAECGYYHMNGGLFKKASFLIATGGASTSGTGNCVFEDTLAITNNGTYYFTMSSTTGNEYQGPLIVVNNSTHEVLLATSDTSYFSDILLSNTNGGGVVFGNSGGVSYLASGNTISIDTGGFINDYLTLNNFNQLGTTSQNLTLTGTALVNMNSCTFNGSLSVNAPGFLIKNCTFNGVTSLVKTGTASLHCYGGNVFGAETTISNFNATGRIRLATTTGDTYLGQVTFEGEEIQVAYAGTNDFYSHIDNDGYTSSDVVFDAGSGTCRMMGDSNQELTGTNHNYRKLVIAQGYSTERDVFYDVEVTIKDTLNLISGRLIPFPLATLTMKAGSKVIGGSDSSFVSGPMKKIGNTEFEFPIGKENVYRPLKISAPTTSSHAFTAEYFNAGQPFGENLDTTLAYIDDCSYWNLTRNVGSSEVFVTLSWESGECPVKDTTYLKIASWYDDNWNDLGHGTIAGNYSTGKMTSVNELTEYGNLTWAYDIEITEDSDPTIYVTSSGFVTNEGQLLGTDSLPASEILFYGNAGNTTLYLADSVFSYVFSTSKTMFGLDSSESYIVVDSVWRMDLRLFEQNREIEIASNDTSQGYHNYYNADLDTAITNALTYQEIKYEEVYDDISLGFYNDDEFRFMIEPYANPEFIKFYYQGVDSFYIDEEGLLNIFTGYGNKIYTVKAYENGSDGFEPIDVNFVATDSLISFNLASFNEENSLILKIFNPTKSIPIRPKNLIRWSTYYGGDTQFNQSFQDVYIDENENIYMVGSSTSGNFPLQNALQPGGGGTCATVVKFDHLRERKFSTYYGQSLTLGKSIAVDQIGNIIFTGYTTALNLYTCPNCLGYNVSTNNTGISSYYDAFVVKLNSFGQIDPMQYGMSSFFGSPSNDIGLAVAVDLNNNFYIAGGCGDEIPVPTTQPTGSFYQDFTLNPNSTSSYLINGFIAMFDSNNELKWSTHLGGDGNSQAGIQEGIMSLCTDNNNNLYFFGVSGSSTTIVASPCTTNTSTDFPITGPSGALIRNLSGGQDHFVGMMNANHKLVWSTFFGGTDIERMIVTESPGSIDVNKSDGTIYITGSTSSSIGEGFPVFTNGISGSYYDSGLGGNTDGYIAKFNSNFSQNWTSYIGGSSSFDFSNGISVSDNGSFYVVGSTSSTDFPTYNSLSGAYFDDELNDGIDIWAHDGFVSKFDSDCKIKYSSYVGGISDDRFNSVSYQRFSSGPQHVIAVGSSNSGDFPCREYNPSASVTNDYFDGSNIIPSGAWINNKSTIFNLYNVNTISRLGHFDEDEIVLNQILPELEIFPNPTSDFVQVRVSGEKINSIYIQDMQGRMIVEKNLNDEIYVNIETTEFPSGIYIVRVFSGESYHSGKLMIHKP